MDQIREKLIESLEDKIDILSGMEMGTKEHQMASSDVKNLVSAVNEIDTVNSELYDRQEKRRIDEEKNIRMSEIEKGKSDLSWKKFGFELGKIIVQQIPVTAMQLGGYYIFQTRLFEFEENGRLLSNASRQLPLPRIFK